MKTHRNGILAACWFMLLASFLVGCGSSSDPTPMNPAPTASILAASTQITAGQSVLLTWTSTNATSVTISPSVSATAPPLSGTATVSPAATTTYQITATGAGGTASSTVTVTVSVAAPAPTVTLAASPNTIATGAAATLTWTSTNATSVSISPAVGSGTLPLNGSSSVSPAATTAYTITATSGTQTATASATVTVLPKGTAQSQVSHLIVVMMQNQSFDHLFETFPGANGAKSGDPGYSQPDANGVLVSPTLLTSLASADQTVDPAHDNLHYIADYDNGKMDGFAKTEGAYAMQYYDKTSSGTTKDGKTYSMATVWNYAQQYALADNFFASALYSEPANMLYMVAATVNDTYTAGKLPYYDKCTAGLVAQGGKAAAPLTQTTVGDQMNAANVSWTWYQGGFSTSVNGTCSNYVPQENPFQYFTTTQYSANLVDFNMAAFQTTLANGSLPAVSFITPLSGFSMHPGSGDVSNGIEWLDGLVTAVKNSPEWSSTAIVVLWDESGGWYDHVRRPSSPLRRRLLTP